MVYAFFPESIRGPIIAKFAAEVRLSIHSRDLHVGLAEWRSTNPVFVDAQCSQVGVKQQLLWIDVNRRLSFAFRTDVPLRVDEAPEIRSYTTHAYTPSRLQWLGYHEYFETLESSVILPTHSRAITLYRLPEI